MSHAWFTREADLTHTWASLTGEQGVISGSATVQDSVETDLVLLWQLGGSAAISPGGPFLHPRN